MTNSFISFDKSTGLNVKTKADIFQDLINITKISYGQEFVVVPGTEMYAFLDNLAYSLAETGSATKSVYDSFSFLTATGTSLDVLCSLAGISRKENETDTQLRNRYYKFLFNPAVSTVKSLETKLLNLTYTYEGVVYNVVDVVKILNNDTNADTKSDGDQGIDVPAHGIVVICGLNEQLFNKIDNNTKSSLLNEINTTIENYKTLGCAVATSKYTINETEITILFIPTQKLELSINLEMTFQANLRPDEQNAVIAMIKQNIYNYINNLSIGNDIFYSGIMACVYNMYRQLGYTEDILNIGEITITDVDDNVTKLSGSNHLAIYAHQQPVTTTENITINNE